MESTNPNPPDQETAEAAKRMTTLQKLSDEVMGLTVDRVFFERLRDQNTGTMTVELQALGLEYEASKWSKETERRLDEIREF